MTERRGNVLTIPRNVMLAKDEGKIDGQKIGKHTGKDTAVIAVQLAWRIMGAWHEFPIFGIRKWTLFCVQVFVFDVLQQMAQIGRTGAAITVIVLDALLLHKYHSSRPVRIGQVDGKDELVQLEDVFAYEGEREYM